MVCAVDLKVAHACILNVRWADAVMWKAQPESIAALFVKKAVGYYNVKQCGYAVMPVWI